MIYKFKNISFHYILSLVFIISCSDQIAKEKLSVDDITTLETKVELPNGNFIYFTYFNNDTSFISINGNLFALKAEFIEKRNFVFAHFTLFSLIVNGDDETIFRKSNEFQIKLENNYDYIPLSGNVVLTNNLSINEILTIPADFNFSENEDSAAKSLHFIARCCVTCTENGWTTTACGCAVQMSCGSCCSAPCC